MNRNNDLLKRVRISDAPALCKYGIIKGSIKSAEQLIRGLDSLPFIDVYTCKDSEGTIIALVNVTHRDDECFSSEFKFLFSNKLSIEELNANYKLVLGRCVRTLWVEGFFKVSTIIKTDEEFKGICLNELGFIQEAVLHEENSFECSNPDSALFYLIEPRYKEYNCCFVPFQKGVYVLYGGEDYIDCGKIYSYGEEVTETVALRMGKYLGILNSNNCLLPKGSEEYIIEDDYIGSFLPSEVFKGYRQLKEYFQKERSSFDLNIKFESKSDFRLNVWNEIRKIAYASTLCYEDIANILCDNNINKAKTMVRVVGQACSDCPVPVIIPCHRVIGKDGKLVGYKEGIEFKDFLLIHESFSAILI
ncbi:MAG: methylated-DNA--[protein]-cysteine S-methyltransferase [Clostridia bacterium]|nr:methylated-DNA--[protein]-cysteine S-methyltransferase [Clostridia bacterium]